ncbi:hypothetical protein HPB50_004743 [Hyalomma asiaticum]|uniref:Uncharacterized protein n=1 Tax=Hyalomma asiaticum TaxID=266040 RepID=A0ACB7T0N9_HYAAI|nr:hypothetical protein HPB50_004743 [Hyalomma asiaticum]
MTPLPRECGVREIRSLDNALRGARRAFRRGFAAGPSDPAKGPHPASVTDGLPSTVDYGLPAVLCVACIAEPQQYRSFAVRVSFAWM